MKWESGRPAPPPAPAPADTRVWVVVKGARSAQAVERAHPLGRELRVLLASEFLWSQVFREGDVPSLEDVAAEHRAEFISRGWSPAE